MRTGILLAAGFAIAAFAAGGFIFVKHTGLMTSTEPKTDAHIQTAASGADTRTAVLAGGCFWCVESDLEKIPGVISVVSGYSGGESENPTYENYASGGHREVVEATYDPAQVTYEGLVRYFLKHIDPTDGEGSFYDRGFQYSPAIYYDTEEEKETAESVLADISARGVFEDALQVPVLPRETFWPAEEYHQDYYKKHPLKYGFYRKASGRDAFIEKHWGEAASELPAPPEKENSAGAENSVWTNFTKPSDTELREMLTPIQYKVTQEDGTERAFENAYWDEKRDGIYVDVVSGEPLFSSKDKYESGTGWPSFTKPLEPDNIVTREDRTLFFLTRTEVRSKHADSHLGHVFDDGPPPTGKRYCMNSAALRFIPKENLVAEGYGEYRSLFE